MAGYRARISCQCSSLHLPRGRAVLVVLDGDSHGGELVADAVALRPIFRLARIETCSDEGVDCRPVHFRLRLGGGEVAGEAERPQGFTQLVLAPRLVERVE